MIKPSRVCSAFLQNKVLRKKEVNLDSGNNKPKRKEKKKERNKTWWGKDNCTEFAWEHTGDQSAVKGGRS